MKVIRRGDLKIPSNRQRTDHPAEQLMELASSIASVGLLHPLVVRQESPTSYILVAGERRLKAIETLWAMGDRFRCGTTELIKEGFLPVTDLGSMDALDAMEAELEENIRRVDISWQNRSTATSQLFELRNLQAEKAKLPPPDQTAFAREVYPDHHPIAATKAVREELILAANLKDPDVAAAPSSREAMKVIRRKEDAQRDRLLGESVGRSFNAQSHSLLRGDCLELMKQMDSGQFDCILTDPPYGINAEGFNDSGGKANAAGHTYDDSLHNWLRLMGVFSSESFRLAKPQSHCYVFCDIDNFITLRDLMCTAGWKVFRTPLVWYNPTSQRAPWPQSGPHRRYQLCLYANKGDRPVLRLASDLVEFKSDDNLGWAAQKPVGLFMDLLSRSCRAGDSVLDPFMGSGTIVPAAHGLKVKATGIELDPVAYGIAVKRLNAL